MPTKTPLDSSGVITTSKVGLLGGGDADEAAALAFVVESHDAVDLGEERVIAADADVHAGIETRSALADQNRTAGDELAGEALDAEHFRLRIAAVARRALSFFMSHGCSPLEIDAVDTKLDEILTMSVLALRVVLAALLLEDDDALAAGLADDGGVDGRAVDHRDADLRLIAADHQHFVEGDLFLVSIAEHVALDEESLALRDPILLSTGTDDGVHEMTSRKKTTLSSTRRPCGQTAWNRVNRRRERPYSSRNRLRTSRPPWPFRRCR